MVVPTTHAVLNIVQGRKKRGRLIVADPAVVAGSIDPAAYFGMCRESRAEGRLPPSAYVFTDQFVDEPFAPLLVREAGVLEFVSATEVVARVVHDVDVVIWTAVGYRRVPSCDARDPANILRALRRYYDGCERLADAWLMRSRQPARRPCTRVSAAMRRARVYESAVLRAFADHPLNDDARILLRQLGAQRVVLRGLRDRLG